MIFVLRFFLMVSSPRTLSLSPVSCVAWPRHLQCLTLVFVWAAGSPRTRRHVVGGMAREGVERTLSIRRQSTVVMPLPLMATNLLWVIFLLNPLLLLRLENWTVPTGERKSLNNWVVDFSDLTRPMKLEEIVLISLLGTP
jgi:hypothetical protein